MFSAVRKLSAQGVLGINARNANYTLRYNQRHLYPRADDKQLTKELAQAVGVPVPDLYGVVESPGQVRNLEAILDGHEDFVMKPCRGSGGEGILVVTGRVHDLYRRVNGRLLDREEIAQHTFNILSGMYSLGGQPDRAMIEYRVQFDPVFAEMSYEGVPDVRIIVFFGVPVMSMVRLPTRNSEGRANLHQGAIGVGVDLASGKTLEAVWKNHLVSQHPDTGSDVAGVQIPRWDELLTLASRCYEFTGIAYQGVDIVLDRDKGPLLLEINARPGLNIQIANNTGLRSRLELVDQKRSGLTTIEQRIRFAKKSFPALSM